MAASIGLSNFGILVDPFTGHSNDMRHFSAIFYQYFTLKSNGSFKIWGHLSCVATVVLRMRLLHAVAFSK